jgi:hypothetical protein
MGRVIDLRSKMATCHYCDRVFRTDRGAMTHASRMHKQEIAALLAELHAAVGGTRHIEVKFPAGLTPELADRLDKRIRGNIDTIIRRYEKVARPRVAT